MFGLDGYMAYIKEKLKQFMKLSFLNWKQLINRRWKGHVLEVQRMLIKFR